MGKGDIKTKKGKIAAGTYGNTRKRKATVAVVVPKAKKAAVKKAAPVKAETEKKAPVKKAAAKKAPAKKAATKKA